jgi:hypothetical protein
MKKSWEAWWRPNLIEIGKLFYLFSLLTFPRLSGTVSRKKTEYRGLFSGYTTIPIRVHVFRLSSRVHRSLSGE